MAVALLAQGLGQVDAYETTKLPYGSPSLVENIRAETDIGSLKKACGALAQAMNEAAIAKGAEYDTFVDLYRRGIKLAMAFAVACTVALLYAWVAMGAGLRRRQE